MENRKLIQRKLIRETKILDKRGFEVIIKYDSGFGDMEYRNPLENESAETTDFNTYTEKFTLYETYSKGRNLKKRKYTLAWYRSNYWGVETIRIYEDKFLSAKEYFVTREVKLKDTTIERISRDLNAEEFLAFLKDNNISYPLIK